ncbi:MAG: Gfo/Idh/MocA family oxidoreductase [Elusimicrobia bacterium]|nr:Gfo/Idh/MocA family oxidoreductase [Elusimicrobiota bacterium]
MKEIVLAQVGCGYWGPNLMRSWRAVDGARLKWLCDLKPGRLEWARENFPGLRATADLAEALADPEVDAVAVATEPFTHHELGRAVLAAGKHLFMEKPLARSTAEARDLAARAARARRVLGVGHVYLYHPAVAALRARLGSGRGGLGRPLYFDLARVNPGPPQPRHDVIWDLAPHEVSLALDLAGAPAVAVRGTGLHWSLKVDEAAFFEIRFRNGVLARVHASWRSHRKIRRLDAYCERGAAFFDETAAEPLTIVRPGADNRVGAKSSFKGKFSYGAGVVETPTLEKASPLERECADFVAAVRRGRAPRSDAALGVAVVRVLEAAARSAAAGGREVRLT